MDESRGHMTYMPNSQQGLWIIIVLERMCILLSEILEKLHVDLEELMNYRCCWGIFTLSLSLIVAGIVGEYFSFYFNYNRNNGRYSFMHMMHHVSYYMDENLILICICCNDNIVYFIKLEQFVHFRVIGIVKFSSFFLTYIVQPLQKNSCKSDDLCRN
jgi:hypothetical protein